MFDNWRITDSRQQELLESAARSRKVSNRTGRRNWWQW